MVMVGAQRAGEPPARGTLIRKQPGHTAPQAWVRRRDSSLAKNEDRKPRRIAIACTSGIIGAAVVPFPVDERWKVPAAVGALQFAQSRDRRRFAPLRSSSLRHASKPRAA